MGNAVLVLWNQGVWAWVQGEAWPPL